MADGSLNFDTRIDSEGFVEGCKDLKDVADRLIKAMDNLADTIAKSFNVKEVIGFQKEVESAGESISDAAKKADDFEKRWEEISKLHSGEWDVEVNTEKLESAAKSAGELEEKMKNVSVPDRDYGTEVQDFIDNYKSEVDQAEEYTNGFRSKIAQLKEELERLGEQGQYFGDDAYDEAYIKLRETQAELSEYVSGLNEAATTMKEHTNDVDRLKAELAELKSQGLDFGDANFDNVYKELERAKKEIEDYKRGLKEDATQEIKVDINADSLEGKIKSLKEKLDSLKNSGKTFGDADFDSAYSELKKAENALSDYKKELTAVDNGQEKAKKSSDRLKKSVKNTGSEMKKTGKAAIPLTRSLLKLSNMLKLMILKNAMQSMLRLTKEGLQNLAKYSSATNKDFSTLMSTLTRLKNSLATALAPVLSIVTPTLQKLMDKLSEAATAVSHFLAVLSGSDTYIRAKKVQEDYAASLSKTGKEAKKALSPIDELNQVSQGGSADVGLNPSDMFETIEVSSGMKKSFENLMEVLGPAIEAFEELGLALQPLGGSVADAAVSFYEEFLKPVGKWALKDGIPRLTICLTDLVKKVDWKKLSGNIDKFIKSLGKFTVKVGEGFVDFIEDLSDSLNPVIGDLINNIGDAIGFFGEQLEKIEPETLKQIGYNLGIFFTGLAAAKGLGWAAGLLTNLGKGLLSLSIGLSNMVALNPVMFVALFDPLVKAFDEWIQNSFGDIGSKIAGYITMSLEGAAVGFLFGGPAGAVVGAILGALLAAAMEIDWGKLWENFKKELLTSLNRIFSLDETKKLFENMIENFKAALNGDNILEIGINIIEGLLNGIGAGISFFLEPIVNFFREIIEGVKKLFGIHSPSTVFKEIGGFIVEGLKQGVENLIESALATFENFFKRIKEVFTNAPTWFKEKFSDAWTQIKSIFTLKNAKNFFGDVWEGIKYPFKAVASWFEDTFSKAWAKVKNVFSNGGEIFAGIKDGIVETFKAVVNGLINGINTIIAAPFNEINKMLNTIRSVSVLGIKPFEGLWSKDPLSVPKIPRLATGAVIPPNQEFLAVLGDQKRGTNIEAPLDTIKQAVADVLGKTGVNQDNAPIQLNVFLDGNQIYQAMVKRDKENVNRTGKSAFAQ